MNSPSSPRRSRTPLVTADGLRKRLQSRYSLRLHGLLIGSFTMVLMWATSHLQMLVGVDSLALRYLITLGVGYGAYLWVLRLWAAKLVGDRNEGSQWDGSVDLPDVWPGRGSGGGSGTPLPRTGGGGGDFGGAGADEGAVVLVPLALVFLIAVLLLGGAGALAMLYFGWDVLLAVAVELAFSVVTARAAVGMERGGWLGATIDHFLPGVQSLPQAVRAIQGR